MPKPINILTADECNQLINYTARSEPTDPHHKRDIRTRELILLMLDAGLRVGEAVQLPVSSLELFGEPTKNVLVPAGIAKNKLERLVPMTERLIENTHRMVRYWWAPDKVEPHRSAFYVTANGGHITTRQVQRTLEAVGRAVLKRKIYPHILRHTFATRLMRQTNIRVVQQLLGHKSLTSTQIYTHPNSEDLRKAIGTLNGPEE